MSFGWCRRDAEALGTVDLALHAGGDVGDSALRVLVTHVEIALAAEPVFLGALSIYGTAEHVPMWRRMARITHKPAIRQRMAAIADHGEGIDTLLIDSPDDLAELLTAEDLRSLSAAVTAESRGEFETALKLLRSVPMRVDDAWVDSLRIMCEGPTDPLLLGRFICLAAYRSILRSPGMRELVAHFTTVVQLASGVGVGGLKDDPLLSAAEHPVIKDAILFDAGGLGSYVLGTLAHRVVEQVPGVEEWVDTPPSVLRMEADLGEGLVRCHDLVTRDKVVVSAEGLADAKPIGTCLYGRLVTLAGSEHGYFALQPLGLDTLTASRVAAAVAAGNSAEDRITEMCRGIAPVVASQTADVA